MAQGEGAKYSFDGVGANGSTFSYSFSTSYDGKDSAISGSGIPAGADTIALKRVNPHRVEGTLKMGGKEVGKVEVEVSKDGKFTTVKVKGKTTDGKDYSSETVYDKQ